MKPRRVLVLMHEELVPPDSMSELSEAEVERVRTEHHVVSGLEDLGHQVVKLGIGDELAPLRRAIAQHKPHVVFNMLEDFGGEVLHDFHVVAYLEMRRVAYTGCNPRGMILARDKALSKKILHYHRIKLPRFTTFRRGRAIRLPKGFGYPAIVKSLIYEASLGIAQASVVYDDDALVERIKFMHEHYETDAIVEEFIDGREIYSAVLGNRRLEVFPTWELSLDKLPEDAPRIATRKVKLDVKYQKKYDINHHRAKDISPELERHIIRTSRRICRALNLDGYVRLDYRLTEDGQIYFLEANPNPEIAWGEEYASAAEEAGLSYEDMLQRIVSLGIRRRTGR